MFILLQNLIFTGFGSCSADLFCLRQRDISYHVRVNLSSTFLYYFEVFWIFSFTIYSKLFKIVCCRFKMFFAATNDILPPNCRFVNNFVEVFSKFFQSFVTVQPSFPTFIKPDSNFYIKKIYSYVLLSAAALQLLFYSLREWKAILPYK